MEITIKRCSRKMTYEDAATLDEFWELAKRTERSLDWEQRRYWDGRECGVYIIAAQGVLPYCATAGELVCQQERFLLYALYDYSYAEIGRLCGCSKAAVHESSEKKWRTEVRQKGYDKTEAPESLENMRQMHQAAVEFPDCLTTGSSPK